MRVPGLQVQGLHEQGKPDVTARSPKLTALDQAVLAAVPEDGRGRRATVVRCTMRVPSGQVRPDAKTTTEILRGLEAIRLVRESGGWWRR